MLEWFKKPRQGREHFREALFGDVPVPDWLPDDKAAVEQEPWKSFAAARHEAVTGNKAAACDALERIDGMPGLDPRHYLQAWHFLRLLGRKPPDALAARVYGVVVEIATNRGYDVLAAYSNGSARFLSAGGTERTSAGSDQAELYGAALALLQASHWLLEKVDAYPGKHPAPPPEGEARLSLLTAGGIHFGQGKHEEMKASPLAKPAMEQAAALVKLLCESTDVPKAAS